MPVYYVLHQASTRLARTLPILTLKCASAVCVASRSAHPALAATAATNMSSMLHDSVQALAGDGLGHGVPLGQTGL